MQVWMQKNTNWHVNADGKSTSWQASADATPADMPVQMGKTPADMPVDMGNISQISSLDEELKAEKGEISSFHEQTHIHLTDTKETQVYIWAQVPCSLKILLYTYIEIDVQQ